MKDARVQLWNFAPIFTADFRQKIMKIVDQMIFFAWNDFSWMYWEETKREIASPTPNFFHLVDATLIVFLPFTAFQAKETEQARSLWIRAFLVRPHLRLCIKGPSLPNVHLPSPLLSFLVHAVDLVCSYPKILSGSGHSTLPSTPLLLLLQLRKQEPRGSNDATPSSAFFVHFLSSDGRTDWWTEILMSFVNCLWLSFGPCQISSSSEHRKWRFPSFENIAEPTDQRTDGHDLV